MPESMIATWMPRPVYPSCERAMSAPVICTANARSGSKALAVWSSVAVATG